ncbi:hypothetical protein C7H19_18485 [Aphanothece hegewaldii CCALA 016]|uniref:Uncharacterized protein n=1 Tax=Aphanothece hegewaldii CCALA 016 TaxID=2107694 RepID=A0A2T1LU14_9CHRO|nr:hypothetical protein [Aphanothece hegewaldii]PSF34554.1 hypothetical protein C7H19_18485 [Aphanothece hegewaldii CCALA 016]
MLKKLVQKQLFFGMAFLSFSLIVMTAMAQEKLTTQSKVTINAIGSIRVGMTPQQATQSSGVPIVLNDRPDPQCAYYKPQGKPKDIWFMVNNGTISRIDIVNPQITTLSGAKIGDTEAQIKSLYPGQIQVTPHKYVEKGHYLTFVPKDAVDKNYRLIFETDGKRVTRYRSGKLPEVEWVEGCS